MKKKKKSRLPFSKWVILKIRKSKTRSWILFFVAVFVSGQIINIFWNDYFTQFCIHQLLLMLATYLLLRAMRVFFSSVDSLESSPDKGVSRNPELYGLIKRKLRRYQSLMLPFVFGVIISAFFFFCIVRLEYIKIDIVGLYAILLGSSSVCLGVYSYYQYLVFLKVIKEMSSLSITDYNTRSPADTGWIVHIAETSRRLMRYFASIGLIYVIEYSILIPSDKIQIGFPIKLDTPDNIAFIVSWVALFILVIIAFPTLSAIQHKYIANVVAKMKNSSTDELSKLMYIEKSENLPAKDKLFSTVMYDILISNVKQAKNYPIKRKISCDSIATAIAVIVHILNLYTKVAQIPSLTNLLPQL